MATIKALHADHTRLFRLEDRPFYMVYPVLSRRAGGISVGINLNLDKACNFDCIYCQVDRTLPSPVLPPGHSSEVSLVLEELRLLFDAFGADSYFGRSPFADLPEAARRVRDIAFSGDGEPTLAPSFREVAGAVRAFVSERDWGPDGPPMLRLITNGSGLFPRSTRLFVRKSFLEDGPGEVWLKLDCADPVHFARIDRSPIPFDRMMGGLDHVVRDLPVTIQTMILDYGAKGDPGGFSADRTLWEPLLAKMDQWVRSGADIRAWHLYSVARPPSISAVRRVPEERLRAWADEASFLPFPVQVFP